MLFQRSDFPITHCIRLQPGYLKPHQLPTCFHLIALITTLASFSSCVINSQRLGEGRASRAVGADHIPQRNAFPSLVLHSYFCSKGLRELICSQQQHPRPLPTCRAEERWLHGAQREARLNHGAGKGAWTLLHHPCCSHSSCFPPAHGQGDVFSTQPHSPFTPSDAGSLNLRVSEG